MAETPTPAAQPTPAASPTDAAFDMAAPSLDKFNVNMKVKITLTDADKEKFFKAFLADKPFTETVRLFGDKFSITFASPTIKQNNDIFRQVAYDQKKGLAKYEDSYFIQVTMYRLSVCLAEVDGKPFCPEITPENNPDKDDTSYVKLRADQLSNLPAYKLSMLLDAFQGFDRKVTELASVALTPDFWKANL